MNRNLFNFLLVLSFLSIFLNRVASVRAQQTQNYFQAINSPDFKDLLPADSKNGTLSGNMVCRNQVNYFEFRWGDEHNLDEAVDNIMAAIGWGPAKTASLWRREGSYDQFGGPHFFLWREFGNLLGNITTVEPLYIPLNNPLGTFEFVVSGLYTNSNGISYTAASNVYKPKINIDDVKKCSGFTDKFLVDNAIGKEGQKEGLDGYVDHLCAISITPDKEGCINYGKTVCPSDVVSAVSKSSTGFGAIGASIGDCINKRYPLLEPKDYCPKQTNKSSCLFYSNCQYFEEDICGINKCVPKNTSSADVCLANSRQIRVRDYANRDSLFGKTIRNSCFQGDNNLTVDEDCVQALRDSCIYKTEEEVPLAGIPDCLYKNVPSKYITQLETELPQLAARPPVRNQAPAAGAPAQAPAQAPPPPPVAVITYALAQVNESSSLQEFSDVSNLRIAGLIYTDTQKPSQSCADVSPTITITKTDTGEILYSKPVKNCYSQELPADTITEFGTYIVSVNYTPKADQQYKGSSAETRFIYKQKPRVDTATTITLEGIDKENGKFMTTIPELEQNGGLAYTACTATTPPEAGKILSISPSIRIDNLTYLPVILSGGNRQILNCQQQTISYDSIAASVSQQVTDISSISITASFLGDTQNNYQKSSESVRVFIKSESNPVNRVVAPLPTDLVVILSHTPAQITPGVKATFQAESNKIVENPKFVLTAVTGHVTTLSGTNISRDDSCKQTGGNCLYSASATTYSGLSKIAFYNGDNLIQEIVASNASGTSGSGQNGSGSQQTGSADNGQVPAGDAGGNQGGQAQAPAVVTPPVRNIIGVYLQLPGGEVELLANNGQVDLQVPVGKTEMNIKIVYDIPDQYGSNTHIKPFTVIFEPPQAPPAQTSTSCTPREYHRECVKASECRYSVEQCRADGSGFDDLGTEENCKIASEEVPGGCNTKQPEAPPPAPVPEGPSESCWRLDHNECLGCNISRSVEICNGETRVKPGTENGITDNDCLTYIPPTHVRNQCTFCNKAQVINAYCTGQEYVAEEDVDDYGCADRCGDQPEPGQTCDPNDPNYLAYYCQGDQIAVYKHLNEACEIKFDTVDCKDRGQVCSLGDCVDP